MPYHEIMIRPMREELTRLGIEEARTPEQVDQAIKETGTLMVVVNSVCGCAAGKARPGIAMAMRHSTRPDRAITVFAGGDIEATERARGYFKGYQPSSPSIEASGTKPSANAFWTLLVRASSTLARRDAMPASAKNFCNRTAIQERPGS